jgi:glutamate/tyrosine decarboxylase-like PLP-dependent enzyme
LDVVRLTFLGAAGEVTGSCLLVEAGDARFVVDAGMFQGGREAPRKNREAYVRDLGRLDFVLLTHAHIDHCGLLPRFAAAGRRGPQIYCTKPTADLVPVMLKDSAHVQSRGNRPGGRRRRTGADEPPLYTAEDVDRLALRLNAVPYDVEFRPHPAVSVRLRSAGHIVGAAFAEIRLREGARERLLVVSGDLGEASPLVVYVSAHSHSSVEKAALLAGFGRANIRVVATDERHALRADELARAVREDRAAGRVPCAVVATCGTTTTTAFDPLDSIAAVAAEHGLWMHVDAAMAGSAMILPECRPLWAGIEGADSLVMNPHKWLGTAFDCSLYYVRDPQHLVRVMSTNPSYLQSAVDGRVKNLRDWGIPLGRRFRALKLWCLIREQGVAGLQRRLRRDLDNARWLEAQVRGEPQWRVLAPVTLQTLCVRHEPTGLEGDALDRHTLGWAERVNASGEAYVTPAMLDGRWMVRLSVGSLTTEREHVAALWDLLRAEASRHG